MNELSVVSLSKSFGGVRAVDDVSFQIKDGEFLALIGPNGAGKSTCFNMINGQIVPDSGEILFRGRNIAGLPPRAIWRLGAGRTFQVAATFNSMTVAENVQIALISHKGEVFRFGRPAITRHRTQALDLLDQVGMLKAADVPCRQLSYGDVKRVELAIAFANDPNLLLVDEPTAGMAPRERNDLIKLLKQMVIERGISVLFTEHSMDVVFAYADRIIVMARGRIIADSDPLSIRNDPQVQATYLGTGSTFEHRGRDPSVSATGALSSAGQGTETSRETLLQVEGLNAWYAAAHILHGINLRVGRGEVVAVMGRNGVGKSTTMKAIMGLIHRRAQCLNFNQSDISGLRPFEIARLGLGFTPEDRRIFADLTVLENLEIGQMRPRFFANGTRGPTWTTEKLFALFPNLAETRYRRARNLSGGEQQMLTVARTLMGNPLLVLLDEPSEGVAPLIVEQMANALHELKKEGLSTLVSEQNIHFAEIVADRVYALEKGQIRWEGSVADLSRNSELQRSFLAV